MGTAVHPQKYAALLAKSLPQRIRSRSEHRERVAELEVLAARRDLTPEEDAWFELLAILVEQYENKAAPIPDAPPAEVLRFLMDQHGLRQVDLLPIFASRGAASDAVNGKRAISKAQAKKLAERFHVSVDCFI